MSSQPIDYEAVLADLRAKKAEIEAAIAVIEPMTKSHASWTASNTKSKPDGTQRVSVPFGLSKGGAILAKFIESPEFLVHSDNVSKFLGLLTWLYKQDPGRFKGVTAIQGRSRKYFAENAQEIEDSGSSVMPKSIPRSPFWVATNNDNQTKKRILAEVMRFLGYVQADIQLAIKTIW